MNLFGGLFDNPAIKKLAFSGLRKLMQDESLQCIVLINNPENDDGPIPGFDVQMFREKIQIFDMDTVGLSIEQFKVVQRTLQFITELGPIDDEVINILERYHKAKQLSDGNTTAEESGNTIANGSESEPEWDREQ